MTLMEEQIRQRSGVINQAQFKRKDKTRAASAASNHNSSRTETRLVHHAAERLTQRTVKFIRWLKNHLDLERDWGPRSFHMLDSDGKNIFRSCFFESISARPSNALL